MKVESATCGSIARSGSEHSSFNEINRDARLVENAFRACVDEGIIEECSRLTTQDGSHDGAPYPVMASRGTSQLNVGVKRT